jgi:hypothetical protein
MSQATAWQPDQWPAGRAPSREPNRHSSNSLLKNLSRRGGGFVIPIVYRERDALKELTLSLGKLYASDGGHA